MALTSVIAYQDTALTDTGQIAVDPVGTLEVPVSKILLGATTVDDGLVSSANPMPVSGTVTANLSATDNAVLDAIQAAVEIIDNAIAGTEMQVDIVSGTVAISGTVTVGSHAVTNAGTFAVQVDAALPAGTNAIGKLAANSGVDIGDVDVTSLPTTVHSADYDTGAGTDTTLAFGIAVPASGGAAVVPGDATAGLKVDLGADNDVTVTGTVTANLAAGTNNIGDVDVLSIAAGDNNIGNVDIVTVPAPLSTTGGGTEATALRVTIASDSTGVVSIDDNGGSLTVDGTVAVSSLPASTNTLEVVGDAAHDAAIAGNPVRIAGRALTADYTAVATGDTADLMCSTLGKLVIEPYAIRANRWTYAAVSGGITDTADDVVKAAGAAGVRHYVTGIQVINGHATVSTEVVLKDGTTVMWRGYAAAAGGGCSAVFPNPIEGTAATALNAANITTGSATYVNVQGYSALE